MYGARYGKDTAVHGDDEQPGQQTDEENTERMEALYTNEHGSGDAEEAMHDGQGTMQQLASHGDRNQQAYRDGWSAKLKGEEAAAAAKAAAFDSDKAVMRLFIEQGLSHAQRDAWLQVVHHPGFNPKTVGDVA